MVRAYILVKVESGRDTEVLNALQDIDGLTKASLTYGIYDLCIEAELETMEQLDDFVFKKIRKIPSIKETSTLVTSRTIVNTG